MNPWWLVVVGALCFLIGAAVGHYAGGKDAEVDAKKRDARAYNTGFMDAERENDEREVCYDPRHSKVTEIRADEDQSRELPPPLFPKEKP